MTKDLRLILAGAALALLAGACSDSYAKPPDEETTLTPSQQEAQHRLDVHAEDCRDAIRKVETELDQVELELRHLPPGELMGDAGETGRSRANELQAERARLLDDLDQTLEELARLTR